MLRVVVVDDSAFMRKAISMMIDADPGMQVVATARDGLDALDVVRRERPDVVTMDVEMPRMDGIEAVRRIMRLAPCPILMISSITKQGTQATLDALQAGAVDFISKELSFVSLDITKIKDELINKLRWLGTQAKPMIGSGQYRGRASRPSAPTRSSTASANARGPQRVGSGALHFAQAQLVALGISTGGPSSLRAVLPVFPADFPAPLVIVQHMPAQFTASLAQRLDGLSALTVVEAADSMPVEPGHAYVAPGGKQLLLQRSRAGKTTFRTADQPAHLHKPSVDVLFESAAEVYRGNVLGVVMTGMGHDGREGARTLRANGGRIIAQDEATSVVYGMPRAIIDADLADTIVGLDNIGTTIVRSVTRAAPGLARAS
ncbi:MAG: chemotaxis response regulator protein-glutamate methylesterase [Rhodothermales bacterium]